MPKSMLNTKVLSILHVRNWFHFSQIGKRAFAGTPKPPENPRLKVKRNQVPCLAVTENLSTIVPDAQSVYGISFDITTASSLVKPDTGSCEVNGMT